MRTIGQRLTHALNVRGLGVNEVDRRAGLVTKKDRGSGYTSRLSRDQRKTPEADKVKLVAGVLGVRFEWLMWGTGPMDEDGMPAETALEAGLRASTETANPNAALETAIAYWRGQMSDEAVARLRAKNPALTLSPNEIGEMLLEEDAALVEEKREKLRKMSDKLKASI